MIPSQPWLIISFKLRDIDFVLCNAVPLSFINGTICENGQHKIACSILPSITPATNNCTSLQRNTVNAAQQILNELLRITTTSSTIKWDENITALIFLHQPDKLNMSLPVHWPHLKVFSYLYLNIILRPIPISTEHNTVQKCTVSAWSIWLYIKWNIKTKMIFLWLYNFLPVVKADIKYFVFLETSSFEF